MINISSIAAAYARRVNKEIITLEEVPVNLRSEVEEKIDQLKLEEKQEIQNSSDL